LAFEVIVCPKLLGELRKALRKPYFRDRLSVGEARKAVKRIEVVAVALDDPADVEPTLRDPKDDISLRWPGRPAPRRSSPATRICSITPSNSIHARSISAKRASCLS
jgi:hypothetical protein